MKHLLKILIVVVLQLLFTACPGEEFASNPYLLVENRTNDSVYVWKEDIFMNNTQSLCTNMYGLATNNIGRYVYYGDDSWEQVFQKNKQESVKEIHVYVTRDRSRYFRWKKDNGDATCYDKEIVLTYDDFINNKELEHVIMIENENNDDKK